MIALNNIAKSYNGNIVYRNLNLTLKRGDKVALVGPNGAGKTTLLKILAGVLDFDGGERKLGHNVSTSYYAQYQLELLEPQNSILEEAQRVSSAPDQKLRTLLGAFLFSGSDVYKKVAVLSGGEKARLSIAKMLVNPANFLLMDEPTNHLDISSREMLSDALDAYRGTLCFITHDRTLIREIANKIIEINNGVAQTFHGNYDEYLDWKDSSRGEQGADNCSSRVLSTDLSSRELQRQRKAAEGELRNNYYQSSSPVKKRINEIEAQLERLETESRELENYFSNPENYDNSAKITSGTIRHHELKRLIADLTQEWETKSIEFERLKLEYEESKKNLN